MKFSQVAVLGIFPMNPSMRPPVGPEHENWDNNLEIQSVINRPGVAGAVLQTPLSFIR